MKSALGDDAAALAPFFRIPGLLRAEAVEDYLASQGISRSGAPIFWPTTGGIFPPRGSMTSRSNGSKEKGKGVLLLHDIQARTVAALPRILHELKARGFSIVHVVPATPQNPPTPTEPQDWQLHPPSENVATSHWPKIPNFVFADAGALPAPALSDLDWGDGRSMTLAEDRAGRIGHGVPLPRSAPWPRQSPLPARPRPPQRTCRCRRSAFSRSRRACAPRPGAWRAAPSKPVAPADHDAISAVTGSSARTLRGKPH